VKALIMGGGSWGSALALELHSAGHEVSLWMRRGEHATEVARTRRCDPYLPGITMPDEVRVTADLADAAHGAQLAVVAVPSEYCRGVYRQLAPHLGNSAYVLSATKGFELSSLLRMSEVAAQELPGRRIAALSGPSFALEVARGLPTAVVVASSAIATSEELQRALATRVFRAYASGDVVGVEVAGALKNVIAIAAGIVTGLELGDNAVAALITRGLVEISRLARAMGGQEETLAGLAGLGDLVLTCTGSLSRNRRLGEALGRGRSLPEAVAATPMVAEGVRTTLAACQLAAAHGVEMPIAEQMKGVLHGARNPREAVAELMSRPLKRE
jgi:glycerol-3-phosphate dehydrogenase (NAD(P)+)